MEDGRQGLSDNISEASSSVDRVDARALAAAAAAAAAANAASAANEDHQTTKPSTPSNSDHFLSAFHGNGLHQQEHEARVEALQVKQLNLHMRIASQYINCNTSLALEKISP